ncbi:MAG: hypothetical protein SV186_01460 [Candidatus Nanohaloarchaea archaeon]|nr:hypothetical protein [Candidatus Nanohaloarchaea archaeon]
MTGGTTDTGTASPPATRSQVLNQEPWQPGTEIFAARDELLYDLDQLDVDMPEELDATDGIRHGAKLSEGWLDDGLLDDEHDDLELDGGGTVYNLSFTELPLQDDEYCTPSELERIDDDLEAYTVHTVIYEQDDERYLVHADPGIYHRQGNETAKKKFLDEDGDARTDAPPEDYEKGDKERFFIDDGNYELDRGLAKVCDDLDELSHDLADRAEAEDEPAYAWQAERWYALGEFIDTFRQEYLG